MSSNYQPPASPTVITDINIPFGRLVVIILKTMLASIPALIIFYAIMFAISILFLLAVGGGTLLTHPHLLNGIPMPSPGAFHTPQP